MKANLIDPKAFPYTTKDSELLEGINDLLKEEEVSLEERVAKLSPQAAGNHFA